MASKKLPPKVEEAVQHIYAGDHHAAAAALEEAGHHDQAALQWAHAGEPALADMAHAQHEVNAAQTAMQVADELGRRAGAGAVKVAQAVAKDTKTSPLAPIQDQLQKGWGEGALRALEAHGSPAQKEWAQKGLRMIGAVPNPDPVVAPRAAPAPLAAIQPPTPKPGQGPTAEQNPAWAQVVDDVLLRRLPEEVHKNVALNPFLEKSGEKEGARAVRKDIQTLPRPVQQFLGSGASPDYERRSQIEHNRQLERENQQRRELHAAGAEYNRLRAEGEGMDEVAQQAPPHPVPQNIMAWAPPSAAPPAGELYAEYLRQQNPALRYKAAK